MTRPSIKIWVVLVVLLPLILASMSLLLISAVTTRHIEERLTAELVSSTAANTRAHFDNMARDVERLSELYAIRTTSRTISDAERGKWIQRVGESMYVRPWVEAVSLITPDRDSFFVVRSGETLHSGESIRGRMPREHDLQVRSHERAPSTQPLGFDPANRPWVNAAFDRKAAVWSDVFPWVFANEPRARPTVALSFARPVLEDGGLLIGVLMIDITARQIEDVIAKAPVARHGSLFILNAQNAVVANSKGVGHNKILPTLAELDDPDARSAAKMLDSDQTNITADGKNICVLPIALASDVRWEMVMVLPESDPTLSARSVRQNAIIISIFVIAAALILGWFLAKAISNPVRQLAAHVRDIGGGSFDKKIALTSTSEFIQLSAAVNDMTERLQSLVQLRADKEAVERAAAAKSAFFSRVTHELRTPLNSIIGYAEMIDEQPSTAGDPVLSSDIRKILRSSHQLLRLINDLLDSARIESGQMSIEWRDVYIADIVREAEETIRPLVNSRGNLMEIDVADDLKIRTDPDKLRQILLNLLSNSAKFTRNGIIRVVVQADNSHTQITVSDTGSGIDADKLGAVLEPFVQAQNSIAGTGLGLTIVNQLIRLLGGEMEIRSQRHQGTVVELYFPTSASEAHWRAGEPALSNRGQL